MQINTFCLEWADFFNRCGQLGSGEWVGLSLYTPDRESRGDGISHGWSKNLLEQAQQALGINENCPLTNKKIIYINKKIIEKREDISLPTLERLKGGFDYAIGRLDRNIQDLPYEQPSLNSFSARFSRWAQDHRILAIFLSVITLGVFAYIWKKGNYINQRKINLEIDLSEFKKFSRSISEELEKRVQPIVQLFDKDALVPQTISRTNTIEEAYPKDIMGLIFKLLPTDVREVAESWDDAQKAMEDSEGYKWGLATKYKKQILEILNTLDPVMFAEEIETLEMLEEILENTKNKKFKRINVDAEYKENFICRTVLQILGLTHYQVSKSFTNDEHLDAQPTEKNRILMNNRIIAKLAIEHNYALKLIPNDLLEDHDFILSALSKNGKLLKFLPERYKQNAECVLAAIKQDSDSLFSASPTLCSDKTIILAALKQNGLILSTFYNVYNRNEINCPFTANYPACRDYINDFELVLAAVRSNGLAIKYASIELQQNPEIILEAVKSNGAVLEILIGAFRKNRNIAMAAARSNGSVLKFLYPFFDDKEVVLMALNNVRNQQLENENQLIKEKIARSTGSIRYDFDGPRSILERASKRLLGDREVVLTAVQKKGTALEHADKKFMSDKEIVLAAVKGFPFMLKFASDDLKNDKEVVLAAVREDGEALKYASKDLKKNREIILAAVSSNPEIIFNPEIFNEEEIENFKKDKEIILAVIRQGLYGENIISNFLNDAEVLAAVKKYKLFTKAYLLENQ